MQRILILKFPYSSLFGGGERHTITLVKQLQHKGIKFYLASSCSVLLKEFTVRKWHTRKWWAGPEPVAKSSLLLWPFTVIFATIGMAGLLLYYRLIKKVRIVYCLSLTEKLIATIPARLLGMRVYWIEHVTFERWLDKNPLKFLYRWLSGFVTIIAISRVIQQQLINEIRVPAQAVKVIYTGIDTTTFFVKEGRWEKTARYNIGCVARLEKEKGIEYLLHALKMVKEFIPFVRVIVVGEGGEKKKLVWLTERLELKEAVQWVGHQREVEKWYHYFDAYVLPSVTRESFGITLIEAMASGIPVVASRIGGTPEIIEHKHTGLLAKPGDSHDLADQLLYLYNNRGEVRQMVEAARHRVERDFSEERMIRDFYLLFRK